MPVAIRHVTLTLASVALLAAGLATPLRATDRPNIVLMMADDQGWGDVGYQDHPHLRTPNLDEMAAHSARFDRFYAAAPVCSPTRGSVLTGRTPNRFGCFKWGHTLRPQEITLAEQLQEAGYVTGHFGKWHLGSVRRGSPVNPGASGFDHWLSAPNFFENDPILSREGTAVQMEGESSIVTVDAALEFIEAQQQAKKPFLAVVWFGSPHQPHIAVEQDREPYDYLGEKRAHFLGELAGIDRAVGKMRSRLRELGIEEDTLVWYCSDNGGLRNLAVTGGRRHKGSVYEGGLLVPSLVEWPGHIPPRRTSVPGCTTDIYPTVLDVADVHWPADRPMDGISLHDRLLPGGTELDAPRPKPLGFWDHSTPGISTPSAQWMAELMEAQKQGDDVGNRERLRLDAGEITKQYPSDRFPGHSAWLDWPWKLHRIEPANRQGETTGPVRYELYDLATDPMEANNVAKAEPERLEKMQAALDDWLRSVVRSLNGYDYESE